jgi:Fe-Mn family superoxide dismutase
MSTPTSRRQFITTTAKAGLALGLTAVAGPVLAGGHLAPHRRITFAQQPLPYAFDALEPVIDAQTMEIHFTKHAATYVKTLVEEMAKDKLDARKMTIEQLLGRVGSYSAKIRNNAGGHYNHELFWQLMRAPQEGNAPTGALAAAINRQFASFAGFKEQFTKAAKDRFGSGWAWLVKEKNGRLKIGSTPNQDNPLMNVSELKGQPLLGLDVWEHAYYLKYQNKRPDYIEAWFKVINWDEVAARFALK